MFIWYGMIQACHCDFTNVISPGHNSLDNLTLGRDNSLLHLVTLGVEWNVVAQAIIVSASCAIAWIMARNYSLDYCIILNTLRTRHKKAAISEAKFSNAFSWRKLWSFTAIFPRVQVTTSSIGAWQTIRRYLNQRCPGLLTHVYVTLLQCVKIHISFGNWFWLNTSITFPQVLLFQIFLIFHHLYVNLNIRVFRPSYRSRSLISVFISASKCFLLRHVPFDCIIPPGPCFLHRSLHPTWWTLGMFEP